MPQKKIERHSFSLTTEGAGVFLILSHSVYDNTITIANIKVSGKDNLGIGCSFIKVVTVQKISGVLTVVGGGFAPNPHKGVGLGTTNLTEAAVGGSLEIYVTGVAGKNIEWWGSVESVCN